MHIQTRRRDGLTMGRHFLNSREHFQKRLVSEMPEFLVNQLTLLGTGGQISCHITTSFVFWENLRRANLRSVLSEL